MDDFSQMLELVAQQLKGSDSALRVERAYPAKLRGNPQCEKLAVIGIQKVKLEPVGLQNFYGGQTLPLGRQATVWVKVSFCCKSGEDCWKLWESRGCCFPSSSSSARSSAAKRRGTRTGAAWCCRCCCA